jgi:hypothetical protein
MALGKLVLDALSLVDLISLHGEVLGNASKEVNLPWTDGAPPALYV